jgi:hypothetical protein
MQLVDFNIRFQYSGSPELDLEVVFISYIPTLWSVCCVRLNNISASWDVLQILNACVEPRQSAAGFFVFA